MTNNNAKNTTKEVIQSKKLNFLHKKDILEKNMEILSQQTIQNTQKLDTIKKEIIKYGFIPKQIYDIIETKQGTS
jgi:transcriptional accessory protein Tex/SPT6